jgi:hypothetical protein
MPYLAKAAQLETIILLSGLMIVVACKLIAGDIHRSGLLTVSKDPRRPDAPSEFSPARAQMLMATLLGAMYYIIQVINNRSADRLPDAPSALVGIIGGSHAIYLGGKVQSAWDLLTGRPKANSKQ